MFLYAAAGGPNFNELCANQGVNKLLSIFGEMKYIQSFNNWNVRLMVDSGGHVFNKGEDGINSLGHGRDTDPPDPEEYLKFYKECVYKLRDTPCTIFELDIYGHLPTDTIDGVYRELSSIKGKFQLVRCFHPLGIDGDFSLRTLKKWIDEGQNYIAISKSSEACYRDIFKITRNETKLHGLALTGISVLSKYPFYSADSTNALVTPFRSGTVVIDSGERTSIPKAFDDRSINYIMYKDNLPRIVQSIKMFKQAEEFYTRLWQSRGIIWK